MLTKGLEATEVKPNNKKALVIKVIIVAVILLLGGALRVMSSSEPLPTPNAVPAPIESG